MRIVTFRLRPSIVPQPRRGGRSPFYCSLAGAVAAHPSFDTLSLGSGRNGT